MQPLLFAQRLVQARAARQADAVQRTAELTAVMAFRGSPGSAEQPDLYKITQARRPEWTRDARVQVHYRKLKYVPGMPAQEKGIDVLVALSLVEAAESGDYDVVVLAAHDTDLEPALEFAARKEPAKPTATRPPTGPSGTPGSRASTSCTAETAGWDGRDRKDYTVQL